MSQKYRLLKVHLGGAKLYQRRPDGRPFFAAALIAVVTMSSLASVALATEPGPGPLRDPDGTVVASDQFDRFVDGQWGHADIGGAYQYMSLVPRFDVRSEMGQMRLATPGDSQSSLLSKTIRDVDVRFQVSLSSLPKVGRARVSVLLRRQASGDEYRATVIVSSLGTVKVRLFKYVGGTTRILAGTRQLSGMSLTAGTQFWIRADARGESMTTLRVRTWLASHREPSAWTLGASDAANTLQSEGTIGIRSSISHSTRFAPLTVRVDSLRVTDVKKKFAPTPTPTPTPAPTPTPTPTPTHAHADADADAPPTAHAHPTPRPPRTPTAAPPTPTTHADAARPPRRPPRPPPTPTPTATPTHADADAHARSGTDH